MMNKFYRECGEIFRLKVRFENLYTSVFLVLDGETAVMVDCATTDSDVNEVIAPALREMGQNLRVTHLLLTHKHGDHAGGLKRMRELFPDLTVIDKAVDLSENLEIYPMPGHTEDFVGLLDKRTGTLVSGDGLQGDGVGKYRCSVVTKGGYAQTIEKIKRDKRVNNLLFSHEYEPWNENGAFGREAVEDCLAYCEKTIS